MFSKIALEERLGFPNKITQLFVKLGRLDQRGIIGGLIATSSAEPEESKNL